MPTSNERKMLSSNEALKELRGRLKVKTQFRTDKNTAIWSEAYML